MKCFSRKKIDSREAFSLVETMVALAILALISSSVLVVIDRCVASAADSSLRMQAFEVARNNMELLLCSDSAKEMVEYGTSEKFPEIDWQNVVETFDEPATSQMWLQAVCSAEYTDTEGELQKVELTHWLTKLSKKQITELNEQREKEKEWLEQQDQLVDKDATAEKDAAINEQGEEIDLESMSLPKLLEYFGLTD